MLELIIILMLVVAAATAAVSWGVSFILSSNPSVKKRCKEADKAAGEAVETVGCAFLGVTSIMGLGVIVLIVMLVRSCS